MLRLPVLIFSMLLVWPGFATARTVGGLYEATVPVADQSDGERRQALHRAMGQVLIKLTGDSEIIDNPDAKTLINEAERYMQQYRYIESEQDEGDQPALKLRTTFDRNAVDETLLRLGIPTWGKERPATLVWFAVEDDQDLRLVGLEQSSDYLDPLARQVDRRGLPLLLPLMDLQDTTSIRPEDVRHGRTEALRAASERYPADVILAVYLRGRGGDKIEARWTMLSKQAGSDGWSDQGDSLEAVLGKGIDRLADRLAQRYAATTATGEAARLTLKVTAVNSLSDYARTQNYLSGLSNVRGVQVREIRPGEVIFELESLSGATGLDQAIALGNTLQADSSNDSSDDERVYKLLP